VRLGIPEALSPMKWIARSPVERREPICNGLHFRNVCSLDERTLYGMWSDLGVSESAGMRLASGGGNNVK